MAKIDSAKVYKINYKSCVNSLAIGNYDMALQWLDSALVHISLALEENPEADIKKQLQDDASEFSRLKGHIREHIKDLKTCQSNIRNEEGKRRDNDVCEEKKRENKGITFDDVIGLDNVKEAVKCMIVYPFKYESIYKAFNRSNGGGILLYGAPGTGKTMIAQAIANEINAQFIAVACSDIVSKWFGESQQNIKRIFDQARTKPKTIIFFDEFEALGRSREENDSDAAGSRIVCELLSQINGFNKQNDTTIVVIAATNRPWDIDSALIRSGRFSKLIYVPLPDEAMRKEILKKEMSEVPQEGIDYDAVCELTEGYSSADIVEICNMVKDRGILRSINNTSICPVTQSDFIDTLNNKKTTVNKAELEKLKKFS